MTDEPELHSIHFSVEEQVATVTLASGDRPYERQQGPLSSTVAVHHKIRLLVPILPLAKVSLADVVERAKELYRARQSETEPLDRAGQ